MCCHDDTQIDAIHNLRLKDEFLVWECKNTHCSGRSSKSVCLKEQFTQNIKRIIAHVSAARFDWQLPPSHVAFTEHMLRSLNTCCVQRWFSCSQISECWFKKHNHVPLRSVPTSGCWETISADKHFLCSEVSNLISYSEPAQCSP